MIAEKQERVKGNAGSKALGLEQEAINLGRRFQVFKGLAKSRKLSKGLIDYLFNFLELESQILGAKISVDSGNPAGAAYYLVNAKIALFNIGIGRYVAEGNPSIEHNKKGEPVRIIPSLQHLKLWPNKELYHHAEDRYFKGVREVREMVGLENLTDEQINQMDDKAWGL